MEIKTTSEKLAKHNALTAAFFIQQFAGKELTVDMLKAIKKATQNDIENGSIERSIIDFDKYTKL